VAAGPGAPWTERVRRTWRRHRFALAIIGALGVFALTAVWSLSRIDAADGAADGARASARHADAATGLVLEELARSESPDLARRLLERADSEHVDPGTRVALLRALAAHEARHGRGAEARALLEQALAVAGESLRGDAALERALQQDIAAARE